MIKYKLKNLNYTLLYDYGLSKDRYILTKLDKNKKIEEGRKLSILSNTMFKTMIYNDSRIKYSAKLLSYFIDISYEELLSHLKLSKSEFNKDNITSKGEIGDYVADFKDITFNIEVNCNDSVETLRRNMDYAFRIYNKDVKLGDKDSYKKYRKTIQLNINNFSFNYDDNVIDYYMLKNKEGVVLDDRIIFIQIYVPNLLNKWYNHGKEKLTECERYLLSLICEDTDQLKKIGGLDDIMKEYINDALYLSHNDDYLLESYDKEAAMREQEHRIGFQEGHESGVAEGILENQRLVVKNMLDEKMDMTLISKITGLPIEEINNIASEQNI